jgi:hypothetical protein
MAQTMTQVARQYQPNWQKMNVGMPNTGAALTAGEFEFADLTTASSVATGGNGDFGFGMNYFRAYVNLKTFTPGTVASAFMIECADDAAMSVGLRRAAVQMVPFAAGPFVVILSGFCPDGPKRYARIVLSPGAGASGTYDAFLSGCL